MSRRSDYDDDDYDDRGRRPARRDEYDDYDAPRPRAGGGGGGLVVALGVLHIIMGSIALLFGFCALIGGAAVAGAEGEFRRAGAGGIAGMAGAILIIMAIGMLLGGALGLSGGIGTLTRKFWGWVCGLIAGSLYGVMGILFFIGMIRSFGIPDFPGANRTGAIITNLLFALIAIGYTIFVFLASFNARVRSAMR